jgi:hypothetical protein
MEVCIMAKKTERAETEEKTVKERKTFTDKTFALWFVDDEGKIRIGQSLSKIMKGECETLEAKDIFFGEPSNTWRIVVSVDDRVYLLKSAKELK